MPAAKTPAGKVSVRVLLDAVHGDHGHFYQGQTYTVDKETAAWLLEDERVAVPARTGGKTEHATDDEE